MPFIFAIAGLIAPRVFIFILWMFTSWFTGVFQTRGWPILGFLFLPLTLLWYSMVENWFGGTWQAWEIIVLVITVLIDLDSPRSSRRKRN